MAGTQGPPGFTGIKRADREGRVTGLAPDRDFLFVSWPSDLHRTAEHLLDDLGRAAEDLGREAEAAAGRLARDLNLDEQRARRMVRDVRDIASLKGLAAAPGVARESLEERQALSDVARAARRGAADWEPRPEPPHAAAPGSTIVDAERVWGEQAVRAARERHPSTASAVARSIRGGLSAAAHRVAPAATESAEQRKALRDVAEAAAAGGTGWQPREEPPEAAAPGSTILPEDREPEEVARARRRDDVTERIRTGEPVKRRWDPGAGGP